MMIFRNMSFAVLLGFSACLLGCEEDENDNNGSSGSGGSTREEAVIGAGAGGTSGKGGDPNVSVNGGTAGGVDAGPVPGNGEQEPGPEDPIDRSHLSDVGTTDPLDYSDLALWACHPDIPGNFCEQDMSATEVMADGSYQIVEHVRAETPDFDCFYVYPTVLLTGDPQMTDFSDISSVSDPIFSQAAPFTRLCRVYAPLYRQVGLASGTAARIEGSDTAVALQDVKDAFNYYMENFNQGRNFALIGHSQGTIMLTALVADELDNDSDLRAHMISALLIGGGVTVAEGELTGGSFQNVPLCSDAGETGCVVAYNSYAVEAPPGESESATFGDATEEGMQIACTNPARLAGNTGPFQGSYFRTWFNRETFAPDERLPEDITTPFALYRDVIQGECVVRDGYSYLEISVNPDLEEGRPVGGYRNSLIESIGMGLHLVDYNLPLEDLIDMLGQQATVMP